MLEIQPDEDLFLSAEKDIDAGQNLKRFFAKRVTDQVRHIMELWRLANDAQWSQQRLLDLKAANEKLLRYAARFKEDSHVNLAEKIDQLLTQADFSNGILPSEALEKLAHCLQQLSQAVLRKSDTSASVIAPKKPIYILLNDLDAAYKLSRQLQFFGFRCALFNSSASFMEAAQKRYPAVIVADIDFQTLQGGLELITRIQTDASNPIPTLFFSPHEQPVSIRLKASRLGGYSFYTQPIDIERMIDEIETITNISPPEPYRVLVVEDSKSQSYCIENMLNTAGMVTRAINDPMEILDALTQFKPEIILMDMYMPGCNGTELATVIRQEKKYVSIPIVFLSSEDDLEVQISAMSHGGDDFLTKPIRPQHLRSTIRTKAERARALSALMMRDSLTGLLNHTSILRELELEINKHYNNQLALCFVMIDIDHFKQINDTYGHPVGDKIIKNLALFLKQRLRKSDSIGRYGGEEFAIVLPNTELEHALQIFDDIRLRFSQFIHTSNDHEIKCTFSGGIAQLAHTHNQSLTVLADSALYQAKRNGRNCIFLATPANFPSSQQLQA